jgi:hydrolase, NUDIX family
MSSRPCFSETLDRRTHDALYDWARASYGASDDWNTLYLNGLALGRLNPFWRERIKQDWQEGLSEVSDDLYLQTDNWLAMGDSLQHLAHEWKSLGLLHGWRDEKFDVCEDAGKVLFALERAAFRPFGLMSQAVHLNGLVQTDGGWHFWIGRRSLHKAVDPDKLDNLVGGGIASGETPFEAACRESEEEAGLMPPALDTLRPAARIHSLRPVSRGIHNEILHIFDIVLPETVRPENQDGEVAGFELMNVSQLVETMLSQTMMHDAQLVTLEALKRYGALDRQHPLSLWLDSLCR